MSASSSKPSNTRNPALLTEILQFHPQLLLDDVVNVANETLYHAVEALEVFLLRWAEGRGDEVLKEVEQGLYTFQTLLESYSDTAFDLFEVWALRNVFALPPSNSDQPLPLVLPHHAGLELKEPERDEIEVRMELDEMRAKVENARRMQLLLKRANAIADRRLAKKRALAEQYAFLAPTAELASSLSTSIPALLPALQSLPAPSYPVPTDSKRPWETSSHGYLNWGVRRLVDRGRAGASLEGLVDKVGDVGEWDGQGVSGSVSAGKGKGKAREVELSDEEVEMEVEVEEEDTAEMPDFEAGASGARKSVGNGEGAGGQAVDEDEEEEMDVTRITES